MHLLCCGLMKVPAQPNAAHDWEAAAHLNSILTALGPKLFPVSPPTSHSCQPPRPVCEQQLHLYSPLHRSFPSLSNPLLMHQQWELAGNARELPPGPVDMERPPTTAVSMQ